MCHILGRPRRASAAGEELRRIQRQKAGVFQAAASHDAAERRGIPPLGDGPGALHRPVQGKDEFSLDIR